MSEMIKKQAEIIKKQQIEIEQLRTILQGIWVVYWAPLIIFIGDEGIGLSSILIKSNDALYNDFPIVIKTENSDGKFYIEAYMRGDKFFVKEYDTETAMTTALNNIKTKIADDRKVDLSSI